jgi:hypothetical protein
VFGRAPLSATLSPRKLDEEEPHDCPIAHATQGIGEGVNESFNNNQSFNAREVRA